MRDFKDKVAVVTGAASGIGRGLAGRFAAEGMRVVLADVEDGPLEQAAKELESSGATVLAVRTDVSKAADVEALASKTLAEFGAVHVLCNNAGVAGGSPTWGQSLEEWEWVIGVNMWGAIHGVRTFVPIMLEGGEEGHIVNTASVAGLLPGAGGGAYTVSKFGVVGLSETLFHELKQVAGDRIGVSVLCPALTNTRILDSGRNYPTGAQAEPAEGTPERVAFDMLRAVFAHGMAPSETAGLVLDAIVSRRFYVLTHPEHNPRLALKAEAILSGEPPPALLPS